MYNNVAQASIKSLKVSPRKLALVAGLIRNVKVSDALIQLSFCKKRVSLEVKKCLQSALANAENNLGMDIDNLYVSLVNVGKCHFAKRVMPRARGRSARIEKKFSKISIFLSEHDEGKMIKLQKSLAGKRS